MTSRARTSPRRSPASPRAPPRTPQRDLDLLSNSGIADQIDSATATNRRVRLDVFAPDGHPRGVTAHFVLDFDTTGDLEESLRVRGDLYLAKDKGEWKIFGYDVDQAVQL